MRDVQAHQTEEAHRRQKERDAGEQHEQPHAHAPRRRRLRDDRLERRDRVHGGAGIHLPHARLDEVRERRRIARGANHHRACRLTDLERRVVDVELHLVDASIAHVADDADDRPPLRVLAWRERAVEHALVERILSGPQLARRGLADDGDSRRVRGVLRREQTAAAKRQLHRGEQTRRRNLVVQRRIPARRLRGLRLAVEHDAHALTDRSERQRPEKDGACRVHARQRRDALQHLMHELIRRRLRDLLLDADREHVRGIESQVDRPQVA